MNHEESRNSNSESLVIETKAQKDLQERSGSVEENIATTNIDVNAEVIKDRGVYRVEALKKILYTHKNGLRMRIILGVSVLLCAWASSLDWAVTYSLQPWATSAFRHHSMGLGTLNIAVQIINGISKPVWARTANIVSRPATYTISMFFYVIGYVIVASSNTISAYIVGSALSAAGSSGVDFLNSVIVADMTSLKWRALGTSILATPYIINTWYVGKIVQDLGPSDWRWGYGMFCIIMPVVLSPATIIMFLYEGRAHEYLGQQEKTDYSEEIGFKKNWKKLLWRVVIEVDAFGLLILGFGFSLLLLPFSLYDSAEDQWRNPSLIAMFVVGGILVIFFFVYESFWAPFPVVPKRCLNRTLVASVVINFFYQFAGMIPLVYQSSFVYIVKDWSEQNWTYYNNTMTMSLCVFGVVAGAFMRITHRFKVFQYFGITMAILGSGIMIEGRTASDNALRIIWNQILNGLGGGFNVVASGVALQASIPHRDMAISISILSLFSSIGSSIGSSVSTAIWQGKMKQSLRKLMPSSVSEEQVEDFFADITKLRNYEFDSDVRQAGIEAYREVNFYFYPIAVSLQFIRLAAVFFQTNYYLGDTHNAVEDDDHKPIENSVPEKKKKRTWRHILLGMED